MRLGKLRVPLQYAILTWWLSPHYYFEIETEIAAPSRTLLKTRASAYLPHKADINCRDGDFRFVPTDVRFVPTRDSCTAANSISIRSPRRQAQASLGKSRYAVPWRCSD